MSGAKRRARRRSPSEIGAHSRRKGASWERDLARRFHEAMPGSNARRGTQSRAGDEHFGVVVPEFWIAGSAHKKANVRAALRQAIACAPAGEWAVAVCKDDRMEPFVAMRLEDFLGLVSEWWAGRQQ